MRLTDLLQLIDDLNINTALYFKNEERLCPLSKLTIENGQCLLHVGPRAMTKAKLIKIVGHMHGRGIPLLIKIREREIHIFGLQIKEDNGTVILM